MTPVSSIAAAAGGRSGVRRLVAALALAAVALRGMPAAAQIVDDGPPAVEVREASGVYQVQARFAVAQPPEIVLEVLTDYERIPQILPDIRRSVVRERLADAIVVEQEAVSGMMMFSRRIFLTLVIRQSDGTLHFTETSGRSFSAYDGSWRVTARRGGGSDVAYELRARPAFSVPQFVLRRVLKRDSQETIARLRAETALRHRLLPPMTRLTDDR